MVASVIMFPLAGDILSTVPVPVSQRGGSDSGGGEDTTYWLEDSENVPLTDSNGIQLVDSEG